MWRSCLCGQRETSCFTHRLMLDGVAAAGNDLKMGRLDAKAIAADVVNLDAVRLVVERSGGKFAVSSAEGYAVHELAGAVVPNGAVAPLR